MGITFQYGTIHKCTRVTFVSVTDYVFLRSFIRCAQSPLTSCGESAAASAAKTRVCHALDNVFRSHFRKSLAKSCIAVHGNVFFDVFGIDHTAVTQCHTLLCLIETSLGKSCLYMRVRFHYCICIIVYKTLYRTSLQQMFFHDLRNIIYRNTAVECAVRIDNDNRTQGTKSETSGLDQLDLAFQVKILNLCFKFRADLRAAGRCTSGTAADKYL